VTQQLIDAMDPEVTRVNMITSGFPLRGHIPPVFPNDRATVAHALAMLMQRANGVAPTVLRIRDTLSLAELQVSENVLPELLAHPGVELLAEPDEMRFDADGSLF